MSGVLVREGFAGASHDDNGFIWSVGEEGIHADGGFFENDTVGDEEVLSVVGESLADFELVEVLEDGGRVTDDEELVFEGLVNAGDGGGDGKLAVDKLDAGDRSFEINGRNLKGGVASGIDERSGLETDEKINRDHNHEEGDSQNLDEARRPAERVKIAIMRYEELSDATALCYEK